MRWVLMVTVLAALACSEDAAVVRPEPSAEPAFHYDLYCDAQGHITTDGPVLALVRRPAHLKQVYADASQRHPRAIELVREVELVIAQAGATMAERSSAPHCLVVPELGCLPHWPFLDELFGDSPEATRLREVFARAYETRAKQRGVENAVIAATVNLLLAHGMVEGAVERAATEGAGRGGTKLKPDPAAQGPHTTFKRDPRTGQLSSHAEWDAEGHPIKRTDLGEKGHGNVPGPHTHEYGPPNTNPATGKSYPGNEVRVRPAAPDELPR